MAAFFASDALEPVLVAGAALGAVVAVALVAVAVLVAGAAVLAVLEALALADAVVATSEAEVLAVAAEGDVAATGVAGAPAPGAATDGAATTALGAAVPAELAAARAAAMAALALAIAAAVSFETCVVLAVFSTFFLQAEKEPSPTTAHIASKKRNPICVLRPWPLGVSRVIGASCLKVEAESNGADGPVTAEMRARSSDRGERLGFSVN